MSVATQIVQLGRVAAATNAGSPIVVSDPEHQLSIAIRELATELAGQMVGRPGNERESAPQATPAEADAARAQPTQETEQVMNLADRLAAARAAGMTQDEAERAAALLTDDVRGARRGPARGRPRHPRRPDLTRRLRRGRGQRGRRRQAPRRRAPPTWIPATTARPTGSTPRRRPPPAASRPRPSRATLATVNLDTSARRGTNGQIDRIEELKSSVHVQLLQQMGPRLYDSDMDQNELDTEVRKVLVDVLGSQDRPLSSSDRARVTQEISDDILGYGPIEPFLRDPDVSEVMVNGHNQVYVEKGGRLMPADAHFTDEAHLRRTIDKIVSRIGRRVDESSPMVDARLPDGSRVNAIVPPLAVDGSVAHDPQVRHRPADGAGPDQLRLAEQRDRRLPRRLRPRAAQHHRVRQHRRREDDDAQRAVVVHPARRADRHHRGRRRAPAQAGPRGPARVAPVQHRGQGRGDHPRPGEEQPAHAARPHHRR